MTFGGGNLGENNKCLKGHRADNNLSALLYNNYKDFLSQELFFTRFSFNPT